MSSATKSVIHQKKRLTMNQPIKLWPLLRAIEAGQNASITQIISKNINQKKLNVTPKNVVANISCFLLCFISTIQNADRSVREASHGVMHNCQLSDYLECSRHFIRGSFVSGQVRLTGIDDVRVFAQGWQNLR
jgi:hypothetical protein